MVQSEEFKQIAAKIRQMDAENQKLREGHAGLRGELDAMQKIMSNVTTSRSGMAKGPGHGPYVDIAQVPGRHIPFDFLVDIPIRDGETNTQQGTLQVSMEGPFVATHRMAVFRSQQTFRVQGGTTAAFNGRSFGRFRPIHSAGDIMDAMRAFEQPGAFQPSYLGGVWNGTQYVPIANPMSGHGPSGTGLIPSAPNSVTNAPPPFPGNGTPLYESPIAMSAFRTMEMDATIVVEVQGSNFQRSNSPVPSTFWSKFQSDPWDLPTLDVYEPGESVVVKVTPTHPTNAAYGNIGGLMLQGADGTYNLATGGSNGDPSPNPSPTPGLPIGGWPFLQGQYDGHEGIDGRSLVGDAPNTPDRVTRANDGILTIGFAGFRIVQAPQMMRLGGPRHGRQGTLGVDAKSAAPRRLAATGTGRAWSGKPSREHQPARPGGAAGSGRQSARLDVRAFSAPDVRPVRASVSGATDGRLLRPGSVAEQSVYFLDRRLQGGEGSVPRRPRIPLLGGKIRPDVGRHGAARRRANGPTLGLRPRRGWASRPTMPVRDRSGSDLHHARGLRACGRHERIAHAAGCVLRQERRQLVRDHGRTRKVGAAVSVAALRAASTGLHDHGPAEPDHSGQLHHLPSVGSAARLCSVRRLRLHPPAKPRRKVPARGAAVSRTQTSEPSRPRHPGARTKKSVHFLAGVGGLTLTSENGDTP